MKPTGELKAQIDEIDKQIADATRLGKNAELRRLMAKGTTLLAGRPWTDVLDYTNSVVLRTEHVVADSTKPYPVRLEQIYSPSIELTHSLTAHVSVRQRPLPRHKAERRPRPARSSRISERSKAWRAICASRRTRFELDVHDVADGTYQLDIEVPSTAIGRSARAPCSINLRKGLDELVARLEADAKKAPEDLRADILFPVDRMRNVNRARIELRTFDPDKDFAAAQAVATAARTGKNPFATKTGDFKRHYLLDTASEIIPYRMYVPTTYNGSRAYPLIIALHGLGGTEDAFFDNYDKAFPPLAEQHGYIVAAPLGYRVDGSYGWGIGNPPADPNARRTQDLSEQDVMQVLELVRKQLQDRPEPHLSDGPLDGRHRHVEDRAEVSGHLGGHRAVLRIRRAGDARTHQERAGIHRARRRRSDGQRAGIADDGREDEGAGHRSEIRRGARRQSRRAWSRRISPGCSISSTHTRRRPRARRSNSHRRYTTTTLNSRNTLKKRCSAGSAISALIVVYLPFWSSYLAPFRISRSPKLPS